METNGTKSEIIIEAGDITLWKHQKNGRIWYTICRSTYNESTALYNKQYINIPLEMLDKIATLFIQR